MISHPGGLESFNCGCHQTHPSIESRKWLMAEAMILSVHFIANAKSLEIGSISDIVKSGINSEDDIDRSESRRVSRDISVERERG